MKRCIENDSYFSDNSGKGQKVLIEFVSANPTGPLHIGHGRGAVIGDSLARLMEFHGYNIEREYYINDVGRQINLLGESLRCRYLQLQGKEAPLPSDGYQGAYLKTIAEDIKDENTDFSKFAVDSIMNNIKDTLKHFGIIYNNLFRESSLHSSGMVDDILKNLPSYIKDGALWFKATDYSDEKDRVLVRADNNPTYLSSDIAYHHGKFQRGFNLLIDIWGADHHGYVKRIKGALKALGHDEGRLKIILYQLVRLLRHGKPIAMSTRQGEFITLSDVVKEVGKDACRFFLLLRSPDSHLDFDLELAKEQSPENPVYYVQYAHARTCSVFQQAQTRNIGMDTGKAVMDGLTDSERKLLKYIFLFEETVNQAVTRLHPHIITGYLIDLARIYHTFYERNRVIGSPEGICQRRLLILACLKQVIATGLNILGIGAPEKM